MTAPAFVARTTATQGSNTVITGTAPTGSGGFLYATIQQNSNRDIPTPPTGWVERLDSDDVTNVIRVHLFEFDATAGDPGDFTFNFAGGAATNIRLTIARYSGTGGLDGTPVPSLNQNSTNLQHPGFLTTGIDRLLVWTTHIRSNNITVTPPATMTERCDDTSAGTAGTSISTETQAAAGASGARNGTKSGTSNGAQVLMFALAPPTSGGHQAQRRNVMGVG